MGNTEVKQLVQETPLNHEEVTRLRQMYRTFGQELELDRSLFASLFDSRHISYSIIDRLFDSLDKDPNGCLDLAEVVLGLVLCDRSPIEEKLEFLFAVLELNEERRMTWKRLRAKLGQAIVANLGRIRGRNGVFLDRECSSCKRNPHNVVYSCVDCCTGYIMGVPTTVHLCGDCANAWEGILEDKAGRHYATHKLTKYEVPNTPEVHHTGVQCDSCAVTPIVGPRHHCKDCKDLLDLCDRCYRDASEPLAHSVSHFCEVIATQQTVEQQVAHFVTELFDGWAEASDDGNVTLEAFMEWGLASELCTNILNGFEIHYVRLCPYEESIEVREEVYHQDPDIGRIELAELRART